MSSLTSEQFVEAVAHLQDEGQLPTGFDVYTNKLNQTVSDNGQDITPSQATLEQAYTDAQGVKSRQQRIQATKQNARQSVTETTPEVVEYMEQLRQAVRNGHQQLAQAIVANSGDPTDAEMRAVFDSVKAAAENAEYSAQIISNYMALYQSEIYLQRGSTLDTVSDVLFGGLNNPTNAQQRAFVLGVREIMQSKNIEMYIADIGD